LRGFTFKGKKGKGEGEKGREKGKEGEKRGKREEKRGKVNPLEQKFWLRLCFYVLNCTNPFF